LNNSSKAEIQKKLDEAIDKLLWTRSQLVDAQTQLRKLQWELVQLSEKTNANPG